MLTNVELHNFKSHRSTQLSLDSSRLHALVGKNSSGKTSVLQALHYLSQLTSTSFEKIFQDEISPELITTIGQDNMSVTASGFWVYKEPEYWKASYKWQDRFFLGFPEVSWKADKNKISLNTLTNSLIEHSLKEAPYPFPQCLNSVYLKLVASNLTKAAYSDAIKPQVEFDGSGLAPTLDYFRNEAPDKFQSLQEMLQRIVPGVQKLGVRRAKVMVNRHRSIEVNGKFIPYEESQEMTGQEVVLDMNTGQRIPAHAISEGTMLSLGILTVLMDFNQPSLVLLDDVEQGLHPKAQRELITVFEEIIQANPNLQIIFSTHSPYIVDELTPSQVHVLSNTKAGCTFAKRLDEHPDVEWAKQTLTTGEFWDAEGEDWVVAGEISD